jgi:hypothetical protein
MKDMRAIRANEKLKRASTLVGNGGLALLIAGLSRWYSTGLDTYAATWILISAGLIWGSVQMNELLDSEDEA